MTRPALLLLYGVDEKTLPVDAECTYDTIRQAQEALRSRGWRVETCEIRKDLHKPLESYDPAEWVVFNLCEGSPSQAFYYAHAAQYLEQRGFIFTGSSAQVLDQNQFKPVMKRLLEVEGVPTPKWTAAKRPEDLSFETFPAIVKPAAEHCSFGITGRSVVCDLEQAKRQTGAILEHYPGEVIVEEFLDSNEYGIALWGNRPDPAVLGISVIDYGQLPDIRDRLCSFEAKWLPETEIYQKTMPVCPAPLDPDQRMELEQLAKRAYRACGLRDYGRVDIRLRDGAPMVLDVNANCALSRNAGFPDTARIAGWDYGAVLDHLAGMALRRSSSPWSAGLQPA